MIAIVYIGASFAFAVLLCVLLIVGLALMDGHWGKDPAVKP